MAKILVVDDMEDFRNLATQVLGKEHEVFTAESWDQVNQYVFHKQIDLVLLDINMPIVKGTDIVELLKKTEKGKMVKLILFSSMDEGELRQEVRRVHADGYIVKTFEAEPLLSKVRRFLK